MDFPNGTPLPRIVRPIPVDNGRLAPKLVAMYDLRDKGLLHAVASLVVIKQCRPGRPRECWPGIKHVLRRVANPALR